MQTHTVIALPPAGTHRERIQLNLPEAINLNTTCTVHVVVQFLAGGCLA